MAEVAIKKRHLIDVRDCNGEPDQALLEIRYRKIRILPPIGKWKRYPPLELTVIHAEEATAPRNRKKISWKLITDLPVNSGRAAVEKLEWYAMRWKIEVALNENTGRILWHDATRHVQQFLATHSRTAGGSNRI